MFGKGMIIRFAEKLEARALTFDDQSKLPATLPHHRNQFVVMAAVCTVIAQVAREIADE